MPRLDFEFHAQPPRFNKLGWVLLLAGLTASGWAWLNLQAARATDAGLAMQIAAIEKVQPHRATRSVEPEVDAAHVAQGRVTAQLDYSWQPAFDALAAASSEKIALLSIEAIQAKSHIKLVAEARQLVDAVAFIDMLQQQPGVKNATLTQHEVQDKADQHPVRCNILVELQP